MQRTFKLYPDGQIYTVSELEKLINFTYLDQNSFESLKDQEMLREKGLTQLANNEIDLQIIALGKNYIDKIRNAYIPNVSINFINDRVGYGLFTQEDIPKGSYVGEYTGIVRKNNYHDFNDYLYKYPVLDNIKRNYVIDASSGSLTRFINHSFHPNLQPIHIFYDGFYHLIFIATKQIKKGTQFTFNYGKSYWNLRCNPENI